MRIHWDQYFMALAKLAAMRSGCNSRPTGAVIVKGNRVIATGYNGTIAGMPQCTDCGSSYCRRREVKQDDKGTGKYLECLHGDTVIKLLDGTYKKIKDLASGKINEFWIYAIDTNTGTIVPAIARNPRKTGVRSDLVKVTLDNDKSFTCTADHKILLRTCKYCEAGKLKSGDSLMPMYYNFYRNRIYEQINNTRYGKRKDYKNKTYSIPTHQWVYSFIYNSNVDKETELVHHKNEVVTDNTPKNLKKILRRVHAKWHVQRRPMLDFEHFGKKGHKVIKEKLKNDKNFKASYVERGRRNMTSNWKDINFIKRMAPVLSANGKLISSKTNSNIETIKLRQRGRILAGLNLILKKEKIINENNYNKIREKYKVAKRWGETGSSPPTIKNILKYFSSFDSALKKAETYNHKVVSVEKIKGNYAVYDLTVPNYNNFAIDLGDNSCVFVHNCLSIHGEQNAINQVAQCGGISLHGASIYCTLFPCIFCLKNIVSVGIKKIFYELEYKSDDPERDTYWADLAKEYGVTLKQVTLSLKNVKAICANMSNFTSMRRL